MEQWLDLPRKGKQKRAQRFTMDGWGGNVKDRIRGWGGGNTKKVDCKAGAFLGQMETWCNENSKESIRATSSEQIRIAPSNSRYIVWTSHFLWPGKTFSGRIGTQTSIQSLTYNSLYWLWDVLQEALYTDRRSGQPMSGTAWDLYQESETTPTVPRVLEPRGWMAQRSE